MVFIGIFFYIGLIGGDQRSPPTNDSHLLLIAHIFITGTFTKSSGSLTPFF